MHWEIWASAGFGVTFTEVIARDPGRTVQGVQEHRADPERRHRQRFFLIDWLTVNFALRDYIIPDKFEPIMDYAGRRRRRRRTPNRQLVNNLMVYAGVGMYLPTKFTYKTPR